MTRVEELILEIESLPVDMRIEIADRILESLNPPDPEVEKAWIEEIRRRAADIDSGKTQPIPAEEVFARLQERFRK